MTNSFICEHDFLLRYVSFLAAECFRAVQIPFFEVDFIRLHNDTKVSAHPLSMSNSLSHLFSSREKGQRSRVKFINTVEIRTVVEGASTLAALTTSDATAAMSAVASLLTLTFFHKLRCAASSCARPSSASACSSRASTTLFSCRKPSVF